MSDNRKREPTAEEEPVQDTQAERASDAEQLEEGSQEGSQVGSQDGSPQKKGKYDRNGPHPIIGLIIFVILQFIALLFMTIATPLPMFTLKDEWTNKIYENFPSGKKACVTAWGIKAGCNSNGYFNRDFTNSFCYRVRVDFKIVEAFCIMTIGFMTFALILGIFAIFQKASKGTTGAVGSFAMVLCIIPWGIIAGMFWQKPCCNTLNWYTNEQQTICTFDNVRLSTEVVPPFKDMSDYGAAFALLVAAWCLQVIACVLAFAPL